MLEVIKTSSRYWVVGYISTFGGPFITEQQAEKHKHYLLKKWGWDI